MFLLLFWLWQVVVIESRTRVSASGRFYLGSKLVGDLINVVEDSWRDGGMLQAAYFLEEILIDKCWLLQSQ